MDYEWDDAKNQRNQAKHGISFDIVFEAEWHHALLLEDTRADYGESRFLAYVPIHSRLYAVIYAIRGDNRRIISVRKANERERKRYEQSR